MTDHSTLITEATGEQPWHEASLKMYMALELRSV